MNDIAHRPANVVRAYTQRSRDMAAAARRLEENYLAALARADATYVDGMRRLVETVSQPIEPTVADVRTTEQTEQITTQ